MPAQDVCAGLRYNEETAAEAHSRRRFLPVAGRRADVPRKLFFRLKDGFPRVKLCFCVLCVLTYLALIRVSGAKLWGLFVFFLCAAVYLYLPGRFWARVTGMEKVLPEFAVPLGVLLGTGFLAVLYCVSMRLGVLWLLRALPPVLGLLWLVLLRGAPQSPWKAARAVYADGGFLSRVTLWCVLSVLFALMVSVKNAHPAAAGEIVLTQDVMWNIGNANSFALGFPPQDIRFSMVRFSYHYLTELVFGALSIVSGIACYDIYVFYAGPLVLAALLCCLYALGICFYRGHRNKALLFTFAMFLFNCASLWTALTNGTGSFGNTNMMHLITNVNAQGTAAVFVSVFVILFTEMARRCFDVSWMYLTVFLGSFALVCFAKGPAAAIVVCSFAVTMLFVLFRKPRWSRALTALAGVLAVFLVVYLVIFSSETNTSVHFGFKTLEASAPRQWLRAWMGDSAAAGAVCMVLGAVLHAFCMQPFQFPLYLKGLCRDIRGLLRLPAERLLANGIVAGGFLAYFLFWHPSYSQLYFVLIAIMFMNLLAVDQVTTVRTRAGKAFCTLCGAVGLATSAVLVINFTGSGMRQLARNLDIIPKYPYVSTASAGDEAAMKWLQSNTPQDAVFATNRIHSMANASDGISSLYTAMSGRQAYMEGYTYAVTNMGVSEAVVAQKQAVNTALFDASTAPEEVLRLCAENGIDYLVCSKQYPGDTSQLSGLVVVYENADVTIYAADQ